MKEADIFEDAFNLLCGAKLGSGIHRDVFECRLNSAWVVKVENSMPSRSFANAKEMQNWEDWKDVVPIHGWLAPCRYLSPDGIILIQDRVDPVRKSEHALMPKRVPSFLTDIKYDNFGWLDGNLVCCDYSVLILDASTKMKNVAGHWW